MSAGRELDALVAEKVKGGGHRPGGAAVCPSVPPYSTDIAAAWQVVERFRRAGWRAEVRTGPDGYHECSLEPPDTDPMDHAYHIGALGDSVPHAICLAALKAVWG